LPSPALAGQCQATNHQRLMCACCLTINVMRAQGSAPRDVKCPSSPTEVKHAAHASPCMFSRLERDVSVFFCCGPSRISATSVWCMKRCTRWILFLISCDHGYTLRQRGEQCPQLFRWRFDDCVFFCFVPRVCETVSPHHWHTHLKGVKPKFLLLMVGIWSWDWLLA